MASSFLISNQELATSASTSSSESKRKKRRKIGTSDNQSKNQKHKSQVNTTTWKSASEHKIYATKLVDALRRRTSDSTVRETADRVLALSAKGRSRWSRAIITNRLKLQMKMIKHKNKRKNAATKRSKNLIRKPAVKKRLLAVQEKARDLSRLVPGCRKITFPNLLDEVSDYIAALEMQVRAMTALTGLLTGSNQSI